LPLIFSTGGLQVSNIDDLVTFLDRRATYFSTMHCVSIYPNPTDKFHLNRIDVLRNRYCNEVIGWSTHENPGETVPVQIAVAKGARIFERHVGITTAAIKLTAFS
jgi:sialic acid synthase SpsE